MNLLLRFLLIFILFVESGYPTQFIDWCQYWRALHQDHLRPECNGVYRITFSRRRSGRAEIAPAMDGDMLSGFNRYKAEVQGMSSLTKRILGLDECSTTFNFCRQSAVCESGSVCVGNAGYCCSPIKKKPRECPNPAHLVMSCIVTSPVSWCSLNHHCGTSRLCCPTRCGYNICV